jgi:hypothetical protein
MYAKRKRPLLFLEFRFAGELPVQIFQWRCVSDILKKPQKKQ